MKKSPDKTVIEDISLELGVDQSFIEKDWYAVQLLVLISELQSSKDIKLVFSGGTSLSKGYGLIKRFSEDLDFILTIPEGISLSAGQRRAFRKKVVSAIQNDERFNIEEVKVLRGDSHRFFKIPIHYDRVFDGSFLRPHLQLEMTFMELKKPVRPQSIRSIVSEVTQEEPELEIDCVSAIETAGDKLSALTWRILVRDRSDEKDDPTLIRHLHDLAALENTIIDAGNDFVSSAKESLEIDKNRRGGNVIADMLIPDRLANALKILKEDGLYQKEYEQFVESMSYADEDELISFEEAVAALGRIIGVYNQ
ncbi:MAG: nucleotidyl transferase AbiEii/AbiGii toxin family protein [Desulfosarcina sp.]|nr:nucleotidyl transferase AbiEii/AbiGii toxin family protein [Desulfobacterales bacterium]